MNNGRVWCVVNPTIGIPAFLGSVALIAFTVHFAILNNTTWVADFFKGSSKTTASLDQPAAPLALKSDGSTSFVINVVPTGASSAKPIIVTVTPEGKATVVDGFSTQAALATKAE